MLIKNMTITNSRGDSISFGRQFKLIDDFDTSNLQAQLNYHDTTGDGSLYYNTVLENRPITIPFFIEKFDPSPTWYEEQRAETFRVINPKFNPMRIDIETRGGKSYFIKANAESTPAYPKGFENDNRAWAKGFIYLDCGDPYFYESVATVVNMGNWIPNLEFPLEIPESGIEVGYYSNSLIHNAINSGAVDTGMLIRFIARNTVVKPSLTDVNTYENLVINTTMQAGDVIEVSTFANDKTVTLIRDNIRTNIFNTVTLDSEFLQLYPGDNLFRYDAQEGLDYLEVSISYNNKYVGV